MIPPTAPGTIESAREGQGKSPVNSNSTVNGKPLRFRDEVAGIEGANGAQGRDRTADTVIFSHVLYQLSYLGPDRGQRGDERPSEALH